jgi:hypothetical protein
LDLTLFGIDFLENSGDGDSDVGDFIGRELMEAVDKMLGEDLGILHQFFTHSDKP